MELFKSIFFTTALLFVLATFSQCAGGKQFDNKLPFEVGGVYYQQWVSGVEGGVKDIVIPITSNSKKIKLDSVYFHKKQAKLEYLNNGFYVGRFEYETDQKTDIIMSNEPYAEYGNQVPKLPKKPRFQLKEDECLVSYKVGNKTKYFKISGIIKKEYLNYP
ncbi:MAG: hypothetical protein WA839_14195 [Flavobacteriaceae bacterium]|uniref:hypothetical protein n=1 Tax=Mariniflexile sp. TaxID=1979402 RepID=UPI003C852440